MCLQMRASRAAEGAWSEHERQVEEIVDGFRSRWVIGEYFEALETGCRTKRQLKAVTH
jgi:hypothetical protein